MDLLAKAFEKLAANLILVTNPTPLVTRIQMPNTFDETNLEI